MKIKKILISQKQPLNLAPFTALHEKYGVDIEFRRFFLVEPLTGREFRAQRINLADYTAIVFSSRHAIDAYFKLAEEMRVKVPETMKYFCTTDVVAMYLQKHIVYRKRKIFYGTGTPQSVVDLIGPKHKGEHFLITSSDTGNTDAITSLFDEAGLKYNTAVLVKSVPQDLKDLDLPGAAVESFKMATWSSPITIRFILLSLVLSFGLDMIWTIPSQSSWLILVSIFGHSFVTTALLVSSFVLFRELDKWQKENRSYLEWRKANLRIKKIFKKEPESHD